MKVWPVLLLVLVPLAGCSDEGGAAADEEEEQAPLVDVPQWSVGEAWTYEAEGSSYTYVVTGEEAGDWIVDTDDPELAYFHAVEEISTMGKVRKSDLAGSQGADRVRFFQWPLRHGDSWSTTWDGNTYQVTAHALEEGRFHFVAAQGGTTRVAYMYDPGQRWFTEMTFYDENGTEAFATRLSAHDTGFSGEVHRYTLGAPLEFSAGGPGGGQEDFDLGEGFNEMRITSHAACNGAAAGRLLAGVQPRSEEPVQPPPLPTVNEPAWGEDLDCTAAQDSTDEATLHVEQAVWVASLANTTPGGTISFIVQPAKRETLAFP